MSATRKDDASPSRKRARVVGAASPRGSRDHSPHLHHHHQHQEQEAQWRRRELGIQVEVSDGVVPPLLESFQQLTLPTDTHQVLEARGITQPTPIQMQAIPSILTGRDVVGLAATGSGKTLSYLLPWIVRAVSTPTVQRHIGDTVSPSALIVVPTRELMDQVFHESRGFCGEGVAVNQPSIDGSFIAVGQHFTVAAVCGGVSLSMQIQQLRRADSVSASGVQMLVATPGRLLHLLEKRVVSLDAVTYVVLDEVDRMLDAEMEPQLRSILQAANEVGRQTLLWSATMPQFLERLARSAVLNPITIRVGMGSQLTGTTALHVTQTVLFMRFGEKKHKLLQVLRTIPAPPVIVFCNSHESVDFVTRVLRLEQFHVAGLHGDKSQSFRFQVMAAFREGYVDVLVATDLASRGLDFADVHHVIQFDMPHSIEDYVHRCGRTARRHESTGHVTAFLTEDCVIASDLRRLLQETKQPLPKELETLSRFQAKQS